tara:strand:+ start:23324 stop:24292 length:969 start_codon:yes stop_codon:yes gene_type:complete
MKILLTGSSGFLGKILSRSLSSDICELVEVGRDINKSSIKNYIFVENFCSTSSFQLKPQKIKIVIHCAARVHIMEDGASNPLEAFREVNTFGTLNLARQAASAGVKRFIFISSIKVNGESTELGFPFQPDSDFIAMDPYALSKYEAEVGLRKIAKETGMEVVIIRPPLVYGPGVKANFLLMMKWVYKGIPLPLGGIKRNKRSLVSVDNLVDLIICCIKHPKAANQTFLVSDDNDLSTTLLLKNMAQALGVRSKLLAFPSSWFVLVAKLITRPTISDRLCGSLQLDISKTKEMLGWEPPYSAAECMKKTADAFLESLTLKNKK